MRPNSWSADEDAILVAHYADHGGEWDGWAALLPGRSTPSIRKRARAKGVRMSPEAISESRRRAQAASAEARAEARDRMEGVALALEGRVMALLDAGLPPSAIDARLGEPPGTARRVVSARWRRHRNQREGKEE